MSEELGITIKKNEDISEWYTQVITKGDLIDYSDVSGCIIFKPYSYAIWEKIEEEVDKRLKAVGVKNCYFPLLIPEKFLNKEAEHVEGFAPEVAWVTEAGNTKFAERLAIRPTSETIMYPSFSKWIRSWRDLPLKLNQWNNVVRWEFKNAVPFMRTREFLWNEGHTVFATKEEAEAERDVILGIYQEVLKDYLALYGIAGFKSEREKFAGAEYTTSIELFLESGKAIQGPDFHHDGQKFAKAFDIKFLNKDEKEEYAWQNTWAITTRMIGVMIMMHGDDKGLILPPNVAPIQAVIVPIYKEENKEQVLKKANEIAKKLKLRVEVDDRDYTPGWKFNAWEVKGVPVRVEIGPKDIEKEQVVVVRRDSGEKKVLLWSDLGEVKNILDDVHQKLYERSKKLFESSVVNVSNFDELKKAIDEKKLAYGPFCNDPKVEEMLKEKIPGLTTRVSPFGSEKPAGKCVSGEKDAVMMIYFSRAY